MLRKYDSTATSLCLREVTFVGDSTARQLFWALADKLNSKGKVSTGNFELSPQIARHANMTLEVPGKAVHFIWDPYLNNTEIAGDPHFVISGGLWQARHLDDHHTDAFEQQVARLISKFNDSYASYRSPVRPEQAATRRPVFLPISTPAQANLDSDRSAVLTPERTRAINARLQVLTKTHDFEVMWATLPMTTGLDAAFEENGLHVTSMIASQQLDIILNRMCNTNIDPSGHYCCSERAPCSPLQIYIVGLASLTFLFLMLRTLQNSLGRNVGCPKKPAHALAVLATVGLYCFLADRTGAFQQINKLIDERVFVGVCLVCLLAGLATLSKLQASNTGSEKESRSDELLPRQQTDEWKGWMQIVILLYHYFGMSRVMWVYRLVRLLVASYLFLTGYGHARYFINTNDFSARRVVAVLVRINLLSCVLPFFMGTTYEFYYFPALSSLWFVATWMTVPRNLTETIDLKQASCRIAISSVLLEVFLQSKGLQVGLFATLKSNGMLAVDQHEFAFRTGLDRVVPFVGILTALLQHNFQQQPFVGDSWLSDRGIGKRTLSISCSALSFIGYLTWTHGYHSKAGFNAAHPFTAPIPILAYVVLRNATAGFRNHYSRLFAWFGRHSLETFILQYHVWLAADTKGLLRLGILDGWLWYGQTTISSRGFWVDAIIITIVFLWVSSVVSDATSAITKWIVAANDVEAKPMLYEDSYESPNSSARFSWPSIWHRIRGKIGMRSKVSLVLLILWSLNLMW